MPRFFQKFERPPLSPISSQSIAVSMASKGCVAADFQDAQLENQTSDGFSIGGILFVESSSTDYESFISGLSSTLTQQALPAFLFW